MVGRRSSTGNKKSPIAAEPALASRPKRNISPKTYDITAGLSWKEERELKKALYASLQESKRPSTPRPGNDTPTESDNPDNARFRPIKVKKTLSRRTRSSSSSAPSTPVTTCQSVSCVDETSQESTMSSVTSVSTLDSKKTKVRAQRKFAMNQPNNIQTNSSTSVPCTETGVTSTSKTGEKTSSTIVFPKRAKTEDFLTFLCLRGTPLLPPHLDFFNYSRYDNSLTNGRNGRDTSPSSSSTSLSNVTEDHTFTPVNKFTTPCKKAARASAGTPETCRGLAGVKRMDKSPKTKSPLARRGRPARSLNITPVKVSPSKERLPAKVLNTRLEKRGLGKARLASKRKAVATLTHRASPAKLKAHPTEEQQNERDKVTDGVGCRDSVVCSVHGRIGDGTSKCVECSPVYSSHIDASLASFCMSNHLLPLVPSNLSLLHKEHINPQLYPAWQGDIVGRKKENPSQILTDHNQETLPSEAIQDDQITRDSMLYANMLHDKKKSCEMMATPLSADDVQFAISAVQDWKTEAENQQDICVTNPQLLSANQIEVLAYKVPTIMEEQVAFAEEKLLEASLGTRGQVCPQEENSPLLIQTDNTSDLVQHKEQQLKDAENQNSLPALTEMFIPENQDNYQSTTALPMTEANTTGKVVESYSSPLGDRFLLNPESNLCEVYRDQLYDTQKCQKPSEQIHELNSEIVTIKAANANSNIQGDSVFLSQQSTNTCISNFNSPRTKNLIDYGEYDTPLDLSLPKESNHKPQSLEQGSELVVQELNNNISMCDLDVTRITLNSGNVPQFLKKGTTTIKVEDDKIIIKHQSNREPNDEGCTEGQGVNLKVMNKCVDKRKVKVIVPCSIINGNSSPKVSVINSNNYAAIQELPSPQFRRSSGDQTISLGQYSDIANQIKQEVTEEPEQMEPLTTGSLTLKKPPRTKLDAIQLGSNVFSRPSERPRFVWKSSKLPVFDIMQSSGETNLFSKSKTQQFTNSSKEESPIGSPKQLMPDLLQNLSSSQSSRSKRWKRSPSTAITTISSSQYYSTYTSKPFLLPEQVQKTPTNNRIGNPLDDEKNNIDIPSNEKTFGAEFTFRVGSYKECLSSMTQADYSSNPSSTRQWPPTWLKQCMHPEIPDQNNNTQDTEENGESSEEDREEDKECLRIHNHNSSSSQPISSIENNQIPELKILQNPTEERSCSIQNLSNQPFDENRNISKHDEYTTGGTLSENRSSSVPKTNSQFKKKLFPLPPTIMSSWYY